MKLEVGKYYRTREGEKVGPMRHHPDDRAHPWRSDSGAAYADDGTRWEGANQPDSIIIAEWTDEPVAPKPSATRAAILDAAKHAVTQDRNATHGNPEDSFAAIAAVWSARLGITLTGWQVCILLADLKTCRAWGNPGHLDNWTDLAGYAACGGELAGR